jgi:hypothetical protein
MHTAAANARSGWWWVPALVAALGVPTFLAFWIGGDPQAGLLWGSLSILFALVLAVGGRSDTIRLLAGRRTMSARWRSSCARRCSRRSS